MAHFVCVYICTVLFKLVIYMHISIYICACFPLTKPTYVVLVIFLVAVFDWLSACFLHIHIVHIYTFHWHDVLLT